MGDDPQILDYEDEILHRSDLRSLGEGCWLSDAAISFYLAYAHKEIFGSPDAIQALPPSMAFLLIHSAGSDVADIVQPLRLAEREYVLLPLNDNADVSRGYGGSHWTLLVFSKAARAFWHFDPMGNAVPAYATELAAKLGPLLGGSGVASRNAPRQQNGFDCGVYLLFIAEWICANSAGGKVDADDELIAACTPAAISAKRAAVRELVQRLSESE